MVFHTRQPDRTRNDLFLLRNHESMMENNYNKTPKGNNIQKAINRFTNSQHSLKSIATRSVEDIPKTLNNIQEVAKIVQSSVPIIEKYAPIVRSIPTMYKVMKSINEVETNDETTFKKEAAHINGDNKVIKSSQSKPRLYI